MIEDSIKISYERLCEEGLYGKQLSIEILNMYRNFYYKEGNSERGIIANAINNILPEYLRLKELNIK